MIYAILRVVGALRRPKKSEGSGKLSVQTFCTIALIWCMQQAGPFWCAEAGGQAPRPEVESQAGRGGEAASRGGRRRSGLPGERIETLASISPH